MRAPARRRASSSSSPDLTGRRGNATALVRCVISFYADETGQGTLEYILLLSFVVIGAMMFVRTTLRVLDRGIGFLGGHLEKDLKTGKVGVTAWSN